MEGSKRIKPKAGGLRMYKSCLLGMLCEVGRER